MSELIPTRTRLDVTVEPVTYAEIQDHPAMQKVETIQVTGVPTHLLVYIDAMRQAINCTRDEAIVLILKRHIKEVTDA